MEGHRHYSFYIPAAGKGSRLGPLTEEIGKPLLPISFQGDKVKRIIDYSLDVANAFEANAFVTYFHSADNTKRVFERDDRKAKLLLDPGYVHIAGSMLFHMEDMDIANSNSWVMTPGDHYVTKETVHSLLFAHELSKADITVLATDNIGEHNTFAVDTNNKYDPTHAERLLASLGVYIFSSSWLLQRLMTPSYTSGNYIDIGTDFIFGEDQPKLPLIQFSVINDDSSWEDLGTIDRLYNHIYQSNIFDEKNNIVFPGAYVSANANINNTIVMPNAIVNDGFEIENAIIGEFANVSPLSTPWVSTNKIKVIPPNYDL